ncbi:MAG: alpha/beta hydrolase [Syntrophaceae bacterium]|nr:alpha/beta hydrolase [Syntrophaceae bacterium]
MLKYYNIDSTDIACWVNKSNFDKQKQNLFFIHGSGGNHSIWSHQYGRLHKNFNIVAVNLPGHGHSGGNGEKDVKHCCEWINRLFDVLDLTNVIMIGHSLGAAITLQFSVIHPQKVAGIVCIGGGMKMPVNSFFLDFMQTNPAEIPAEIIALICKYSLAKENRSKFSDVLGKSIMLSKVDIMYGDLLACNALDLTRDTDNISVPALIVCGGEDKMTPPDLSRQLAARIRGARLEIIEGAGHMVMIEKPVEFNNVLEKFAMTVSTAVSG